MDPHSATLTAETAENAVNTSSALCERGSSAESGGGVLGVSLAITIEARAKETGLMFQGMPERWLDDPTWRCAQWHVSKRYLKSEEKGALCLECRTKVWLTFPEDHEGCPKCGRVDLRVLTWRELGIVDTSLGCWDCDWVTFPAGVTADNWQELMAKHKARYGTKSKLETAKRCVKTAIQFLDWLFFDEWELMNRERQKQGKRPFISW
jgi:hypothetical protein